MKHAVEGHWIRYEFNKGFPAQFFQPKIKQIEFGPKLFICQSRNNETNTPPLQ